MADNQSTIALNIGTQRVSLAVFESSKSGALVLKAYDAESILADPASEAARAAQISGAITTLVKRSGVKGKVRYSISGQSVFIRFVKLPPLDDDDLEQLVAFEAQQHVPFPLDEVVWDYEVLESGGEKEVVIVAIKGDALDEVNENVNDAGLATAEVDVAPTALYNAFRAANPGLSEPVLLIDVGAKTSDLLYIEGDRFFTRSAAVGGSAVTTAISKEFDIPFAEAEMHKTQNGLVALGGGHTEQLDDATAALAMCIRNAMTRLATEIPRTTNYYRSQHSGNAPKHVYLAGGGANLPYAKEFFEEKLRLPVDYFNPLPAISLGKGVDSDRVSKEAHMMGELVGLGLRGVGKSKLNIDLVPTKVGEARAAEKRKPFLMGAAALLVGGAALAGLFRMQAATKAEEQAASAAAQFEELRTPAKAIQSSEKVESALVAVASQYVDAEQSALLWSDIYKELSNAFASEAIWFTDFSPVAGYDPLATKPPQPGDPVVKDEFSALPYGQSALNAVTVAAPTSSRPRGRAEAPKAAAKVNAIRVRGFWLKKQGVSSNIVFDLLKRLEENINDGNSHFTFTVKGEKNAQVKLEPKQLAPTVQSDPAEGEFAAPFELVLPLAQPVDYR
ncbi:type IV pilus assembly protein PilM [Haloferula luteola]|uniref:Type IV pilus assembly protein PilM n=1 Tax=Haloferula luteola TaxID=595692 RepID=A0A840V333_9BACT|nr:type IV pilus assembly protein PilM [Haloferula luteola]MBB5351893.1 type IV pilus assembly protein PilM [Haloferula luteola]